MFICFDFISSIYLTQLENKLLNNLQTESQMVGDDRKTKENVKVHCECYLCYIIVSRLEQPSSEIGSK